MTGDLGGASVPRLQTGRLTLRAHRLGDLEACRAMWADPVTVKFIGGHVSTPQQTWMRMLAYAGHWSLLGFGYWAIAERDSDAYVGDIGFADFKRDIEPSLAGMPELGWGLASHAAGRGLATEAARAACAWGDAHFTQERTACIIDEGNVASIGVARKCGFEIVGRAKLGEQQPLLFARHRKT